MSDSDQYTKLAEFMSELPEAYSTQSLTQELDKLKKENEELKTECNSLSERVFDLDSELLGMETLYTGSEDRNKKLKSILKHIIGTYL